MLKFHVLNNRSLNIGERDVGIVYKNQTKKTRSLLLIGLLFEHVCKIHSQANT